MTSELSAMLSSVNDDELVSAYGNFVKELMEREIVTSKNITGDMGEHMVIERYCSIRGLPRFLKAPDGAKNVDALSAQGERYSIKTVTSKTTGSFYGLEPKGSKKDDIQVFEYLVVAVMDDHYRLVKLLEFDWTKFLKHKSRNSRIKTS